MSEICETIHQLAHELERHRFPFEPQGLPDNGIYLLFEDGEHAHGGDRIVRIGTHRRNGQLPGRLREHFLVENKDRSIFRKNIGRAILNRQDDPFLEHWNRDLLSRKARHALGHLGDPEYQSQIEAQVSDYIRTRLSFAILPADSRDERLFYEARLIGAVSSCGNCGPSSAWFGQHSPLPKIRRSGLWQVQHLWQTPLSASEFIGMKARLSGL